MSLPEMYRRLAASVHEALREPDYARLPYWHRFRVHLDWRSDGLHPEGFDLVWHRRQRV